MTVAEYSFLDRKSNMKRVSIDWRLLTLKLIPMILLVCIEPANGQEKQRQIKVGETAPQFTLKDQDGKDASLKKLIANKPVAMVFYRSANW